MLICGAHFALSVGSLVDEETGHVRVNSMACICSSSCRIFISSIKGSAFEYYQNISDSFIYYSYNILISNTDQLLPQQILKPERQKAEGLMKEKMEDEPIYRANTSTLQLQDHFVTFDTLLKILIFFYCITSSSLGSEGLSSQNTACRSGLPNIFHVVTFQCETFTLVKGYPLIFRNEIRASENHCLGQ